MTNMSKTRIGDGPSYTMDNMNSHFDRTVDIHGDDDIMKGGKGNNANLR